MSPTVAESSPFALGAAEWERLEGRIEQAAEAARRSGERALASVTVAISADIDVAAVVLGSRGPGDRWFCLEQPDRDGMACADGCEGRAGQPGRHLDPDPAGQQVGPVFGAVEAAHVPVVGVEHHVLACHYLVGRER